MGASRQRPDPSVAERLFDRGYEFEFFQAVRLLGLLYPERRMVGEEALPSAEVVRFHQQPSLAFPPSAVHRVWTERERTHMVVAFMGLIGPQGALPAHYTETAIARLSKQDSTLVAFLDLFHHRWVSLFHRAWEKHHFVVAYERAARQSPPSEDCLTGYLFSLIGMGTAGLRKRLRVPDQALLLYAGLIAQRPHSASALAGLLRDYFRAPVEIEQFRGQWFPLERPNLCHLEPEERDPQGLHCQLGVGTIAGDAIWDQQARFRVRVGPLSWARFQAFLPGGQALAELFELGGYFVDQRLEFDVQLTLLAPEVPWCRLSDGDGAPRLGWSAWLKTEEFTKDARDTVLNAAEAQVGGDA